MRNEYELKRPKLRRAKDQRWGPIIRKLREVKGWSRTVLLGKYMQKLEQLKGEVFNHHDVPLESWLSRVENGRNVTYTRENIDMLCDALGCSLDQRWEILEAAGMSLFADDNGEMLPVDRFFQRMMKSLSISRRARRVLEQHIMRNENALHASGGGPDLELLLEVVQAALEEKKRQHGSEPRAA